MSRKQTMKLQKNNLKRKRTSSEICCTKLHKNLWLVVCSPRKMRRYHSSFLDLLAADLRLNGRLALAQSCSHRWCQGNRGNFCLINDIGFDIFPSSPFPPPLAVVSLPLAPKFLLHVDMLYDHRSGKLCRRKLTIKVQG